MPKDGTLLGYPSNTKDDQQTCPSTDANILVISKSQYKQAVRAPGKSSQFGGYTVHVGKLEHNVDNPEHNV